MYKKFFYLFFSLFISISVYSKPLSLEGLSKYTLDDIQSITSIDIYNDNLKLIDIDKLIKELSSSDLIYNLEFTEFDKNYLIKIDESDTIF